MRVKHQVKSPWITPEVLQVMRERDQAHKNKEFTNYRLLRNRVHYLIRQEKKKYFEKLVQKKSDSKSIWKAINILANKRKESELLNYKHMPTCAEFSNHFREEVNILKSSLPSSTSDLSELNKFIANKCSNLKQPSIPSCQLVKSIIIFYL